MRPAILFTALLAACALDTPETPDTPELAVSITDSASVQPPPRRRPRLYPTCGDPVCGGYRGPFPGIPSCRQYVAGDRCPRRALGLRCDPMDFCNSFLECSRTPIDLSNCPISQRIHKTDIDYLDDATLTALATDLLKTRLATYRYTWDHDASKPHLGFIIDDAPESPAVIESGERVDLYAYTSMAVAALQVQEQRIKALEERLAAIEADQRP